jgi:hypothetical protein
MWCGVISKIRYGEESQLGWGESFDCYPECWANGCSSTIVVLEDRIDLALAIRFHFHDKLNILPESLPQE